MAQVITARRREGSQASCRTLTDVFMGGFFSFLRVLPGQRPVLPVWVWRIWSGISDKLAAAAADAESAAFSTQSHGVSMCVGCHVSAHSLPASTNDGRDLPDALLAAPES